MSLPKPTSCVLITVQVAALYWCAVATAEENAPVEEPEQKAGGFRLRPVDLYLGMEMEYQQQRVRSTGAQGPKLTNKNRDTRIEEYLGLLLEGDVVDPNLLAYRADLEFGLDHAWYREEYAGETDTDSDDGCLTRYDISFDLLQSKPVSFNLYARRHDQRIPRRFLSSLREEHTEIGASMLATYGRHTTEIGLNWEDIDREGNRRDADDESFDISRLYLDHKWDIADDQQLRLQYDHERTENVYQGSRYEFDNQRDEFRLEYTKAFGHENRHTFDLFARYNEEKGDYARDEAEITPRLILRHTDEFETRYRYSYYSFDQHKLEVDQHKFDVEALYQPTDRLQLSIDGFGLYERADDDVETHEYGSGLDISYRKPTSSGEWFANVAVSYERSKTTGDAGRRVVRSEPHQMKDVGPVFLNERHIKRNSIIAHNPARTRYYSPGLDYVVIEAGDRTIVDRVATGRIEENEVVHFDYEYVVPAETQIDTYRTDLLVEHAFDFGLTPYYAFEGRCEDVNEAPASLRERDYTYRHRIGSRYAKPRWETGIEYEYFDDSVLPYDAGHLTGRWLVLRSAAHSVDLSGQLSRYDYDEEYQDRDVWWLDLDLTDRIRLTRELSMIGTAAYRWEDDSRDGITHGVDLECGLELIRGYLTVDLTVEYNLLSISDDRDQGFGVFLKIRRNLSHLLPKGGPS